MGSCYGLLMLLVNFFTQEFNSAVFYIGFLEAMAFLLVSVFRPSNYTALSSEGIDVDRQLIKWLNIQKIYRNPFSFIIQTKKDNYFIDYSDLKDKEAFRNDFLSAVYAFSKLEMDKVTI